MTRAAAILILIATVAASFAEPIAPGAIEVIDGDTIRAHGRSVRLVGFDAPESGLRAQCESERALAAKASFDLLLLSVTKKARQIVLDFGKGNLLHCGFPSCASHDSASGLDTIAKTCSG